MTHTEKPQAKHLAPPYLKVANVPDEVFRQEEMFQHDTKKAVIHGGTGK